MNLTEALLYALKARGATEVFGIPGDFALPLFLEMQKAQLLPIHPLSHEPALAFAADAASRARGGLGVAAVTYGAGALNLVNGVASAYAERVPLVILSGAPAAHEATSGLMLHHQVKSLDSQWRIFQELTVDQARLNDPRTAPALIGRVLDSALREAGPVYLEIPRDMPARPCEAVPAPQATVVDAERVTACAQELLARLRQARRPLMLAGVEIRRHGIEAQVAELARRLNIPVATTLMGRGLLHELGPQLKGTYLGLAGDADLTEQVEGSDGLLLLGAVQSDTNFAVARRPIDFRHAMRVWQGQVEMGHHVYHEVPIKNLVETLLAALPAADTQGCAASAMAVDQPPSLAASTSLNPGAIVAVIAEAMKRHGAMPVASDVGDCLFSALDLPPGDLLAPGYYASMGYGVPAGLGLQVSSGRRPLILVGDGAFQMTGWELGNARTLGIDPVVVVFNNSSWEMLRTFQPEGQYHGRGDWDFAAMAAGMGGDGYRVSTVGELRCALDQALQRRGTFQLIDARFPPGELSPALSRFVRAVKRLSMPEV